MQAMFDKRRLNLSTLLPVSPPASVEVDAATSNSSRSLTVVAARSRVGVVRADMLAARNGGAVLYAINGVLVPEKFDSELWHHNATMASPVLPSQVPLLAQQPPPAAAQPSPAQPPAQVPPPTQPLPTQPPSAAQPSSPAQVPAQPQASANPDDMSAATREAATREDADKKDNIARTPASPQR